MSSEPRDVDHLTGHRLSDRSRRESGRIAGLLVGERGWYTQLHTEGLAHTTCTGAVAQTLPSSLTGPLAHKVPKHTHTHTQSPFRAASPRLFPHSCQQMLYSFLPGAIEAESPHLPGVRGGLRTWQQQGDCGTCPWGQGRPLEPHPHWAETPGALMSCLGALVMGAAKVNRDTLFWSVLHS